MTEQIEVALLVDQNDRLKNQVEVLLERVNTLKAQNEHLAIKLDNASAEIQRLNMVSRYTE
jgi:chaperonin cofactor prefoldin